MYICMAGSFCFEFIISLDLSLINTGTRSEVGRINSLLR